MTLRSILISTAMVTVCSASEIKIASYNVENLFDMEKSGFEYSQYTPSENGWNLASYQTKLENISDVISALNPDIIALQEVENESVLKYLKQRCNSKGTHFRSQAFSESSNSGGVGVAILSRYPISKSVRHPVNIGNSEKTRNILESQIDTDVGKIRIIAVHWPSKSHKESSRIVAAKVVKSIIDTLPMGTEYLIAGDFNSNFDEAVTLLDESVDNSGGIAGINHILKTTASKVGTPFSLLSPSDVRAKGKGFHYDPWRDVSCSDQFSYRYKGQFNTLDHILLPATLLDGTNLRYRSGSFSHFTLGGSLIDNFTPVRWQTVRTKDSFVHLNRGWSDHLPVSLILSTTAPVPNGSPACKFGSFETSSDGWIVPDSKFIANRSMEQAAEGKWSLKISGQNKSNGTMLRLTAIVPPNPKFAKMQIAGEGEYGIRIKKASDKKWQYLNGTVLTGSAAKTFSKLPNRKWVQRIIPLNPFKSGDMVNLEIRYRGTVPQRLFIDDCSLNGWLRLQGK